MSRETVMEWGNAWMMEVVLPKGLSSGTVVKYEAGVKHLVRKFGDWKVWEVTLSGFQKWVNELAVRNPNTGRPMSHSSLLNIRKVSSMVFRYARANEVRDVPDFFSAVQIPKDAPRGKRRALTSSELDAVLSVAHPAQGMAMLMLFTGLRIGEVVPLCWSDIDFERGMVRVVKSADLQNNSPRVHDGGKTAAARRLVPVPDVLRHYLKDWKLSQTAGEMMVPNLPTLFEIVEQGKRYEDLYPEAPEPLLSWAYKNPPSVVRAEDDLLFTNLRGKMHSKSSLRCLWKDYMRELSEKTGEDIWFTPHDLRHTYATLLYLQDVDIRDAMEYMGHATYQVTLGIYTDTEQYCRFDIEPELMDRLRTDFRIPQRKL